MILILSLLILLISVIKKSEIFFIGGLNLFATYIIGEYLFANLIETKNRPNYVISEKINN